MDMNRPVMEESRPGSSRLSSNNHEGDEDEEQRVKSANNQNEDIQQEHDEPQPQHEQEHSQLEEENVTIDENTQNTTSELPIEETQSEQAEQAEQSESESQPTHGHEKKEQDEHHAEQEPVFHKAVKRKTRPNKFADGNLIPEEGDDEEMAAVKSPGPPPLEPISQVLDQDHKHGDHSKHDLELVATTPDKIDITLDDDYQEIEVEMKPTREELIARYQAAVEERDRLQNVNNQLHHKLADFLRRKKADDAQNQPLFEKSSQEQEQRYIKYLSTIESLKKQLERERLEAERELDELKYKCENKKELVDQERMKFTKMKKDAGVKAVSIHSGKTLTSKDLDGFIDRERQKEADVIGVRIENIKLKNQLKKKEMELKAKEEFGEGLHMIDFEQLKIENQTYNEKIEERNEELMKLKKKINNTVQILTHVKEKLKFVINQNDEKRSELSEFDESVKKNRDVLNKIKQSKDSLRVDNSRLKQNSGLLGNAVLLRDFEDCVDKNEYFESEIEKLKRKHAELILTSKGIKQKINQIKTDKPI